MPKLPKHRPAIPVDIEEALNKIIDYLWQAEKDSFECSSLEAKSTHIFESVLSVKAWLDDNS